MTPLKCTPPTSLLPLRLQTSRRRLGAIVLSSILGQGCAAEEHDPDEELCEAAAGDPADVLAATDTADDMAPLFALDGVLREVTLASDGPRYLRVVADEDQGALVGLSAEGTLTGLLLDGVEQTLSAAAAIEGCPEALPAHHDIDFTVGTWHLRLGPSALPTVRVVAVSGVHGEEEHGR